MERKIETTSLKSVEHSRELTEKCLRTAYFVGYHNRPFTDYPELATLQSANGIKLGSILHARFSCTQVIKCIADAMRQKYVKQLRTIREKLLLLLMSQRLYKKNMSLISVSQEVKMHNLLSSVFARRCHQSLGSRWITYRKISMHLQVMGLLSCLVYIAA